VRADETLTAFLELESAIRKNSIDIVCRRQGRVALAVSPLGVSPRAPPDPLPAWSIATRAPVAK
jgi:hypothetical protein